MKTRQNYDCHYEDQDIARETVQDLYAAFCLSTEPGMAAEQEEFLAKAAAAVIPYDSGYIPSVADDNHHPSSLVTAKL